MQSLVFGRGALRTVLERLTPVVRSCEYVLPNRLAHAKLKMVRIAGRHVHMMPVHISMMPHFTPLENSHVWSCFWWAIIDIGRPRAAPQSLHVVRE